MKTIDEDRPAALNKRNTHSDALTSNWIYSENYLVRFISKFFTPYTYELVRLTSKWILCQKSAASLVQLGKSFNAARNCSIYLKA